VAEPPPRPLRPLRRRAFGLWLLVAACNADRSKPEAANTVRAVSLSPSTTEAMFAIGMGKLLVGRSQHCDHPDAASKLPSVGGFADPNLESIIALRPTIVIGSQGPAGPALEAKLHAHGIETLFPSTDGYKQISEMIAQLGTRFDARSAAAKVTNAIKRRVGHIERWAADKRKAQAAQTEQRRLTVVMVLDETPLYVAGPGSFADELIELAGANNAIAVGGKWPTIDIERLLTLDPDVIIDAMNVGHGDGSTLGTSPGWAQLQAVKKDRLRRLRSATALRPGPRIDDGLAEVARAIYGEEPP